jgi:hypothetical protein
MERIERAADEPPFLIRQRQTGSRSFAQIQAVCYRS